MPINPVPERGDIAVSKDMLLPTPPWLEFFRGVFFALFGWKRSFTATANLDFPLIAAGGQAVGNISVPGARAGDAVIASTRRLVNGLGIFGYVAADDVVQVVRFNYSAAGIDPAADDVRVVVLQQ
jgi:hypothetical protein